MADEGPATPAAPGTSGALGTSAASGAGQKSEAAWIAVVGVCASGKSTLVAGLRELGYEARAIAQEHSGVPYLWSRKQPAFLVVLDAQHETVRSRRRVSFGPERLAEQRRRLEHARQHCDLYLPTDDYSIAEVRERVVQAVEAALGS